MTSAVDRVLARSGPGGRSWKSVLAIVRREQPATVAREILWRLKKRRHRRAFDRVASRRECPVRLRQLAYYAPDATAFDDTRKTRILKSANDVLAGNYLLLSYSNLNRGLPPAWNVDVVSSSTWENAPSRHVKIIRGDGSDVKAVWELSRLQFLPVLGKAYFLSRNEEYRETAKLLVSDWIDRNPAGYGVNWTVSMEVGLRAMSIAFLLQLIWPLRADEQGWLEKVTNSLWQHLRYIECHLEFSHLGRSNHYLSNIVALHCLSAMLEGRNMEVRRQRYRDLVQREILNQVYEDGGDYEASLGYHALVTQLFTTSFLTMRAERVRPDPRFTGRLRRMYELIAAVADGAGRLPHAGDVDDGRVELLATDLEQMDAPVECRYSLLIPGLLGVGGGVFQQAWGTEDDAVWYGLRRPSRPDVQPESTLSVFPNSGLAIARKKGSAVMFCAMPNGLHGKGSHTHNDKLSIVARIDDVDLFVDSGTGCYSRNTAMRNEFRSTTRHNTAVVNGCEQNEIPTSGIFSMGNDAGVTAIETEQRDSTLCMSAAHSGYSRIGVTHRRSIVWEDERCFVVEDLFSGPPAPCSIELNYHVAPEWSDYQVDVADASVRMVNSRKNATLSIKAGTGVSLKVQPCAITRVYGVPVSAQRISAEMTGTLPFSVSSIVNWS